MPGLTFDDRHLLAVADVTVRFGGVVALDRVSFGVAANAICGLVGPNGAGKTTLFNCLSRIYPLDEGTIAFDGHTISAMSSHRMADIGIGRTFQNLALFRTLSVLENVMLGGHARSRGGFLGTALGLPFIRTEEEKLTGKARALIEFVGLSAQAARPVAELPFALQKRVEFARALASGPKLLLLDEPAAGLNHEELSELRRMILDVRDRLGMTVLLVEHHMGLVMGVSDRVVVLNFGRKIAEGPPAAVRRDPAVVTAYLGSALS